MTALFRILVSALIAIASGLAAAGPSEEALAAVQRWSAAYTANDVDAIVASYAPDAVLLGTVSPIMSEGADAIRTYFTAVKGTGNTNTLGDRRIFVLGDDAVVIAGFYVFSNARQTPPVPRPSRFTMLVTRRAGEWKIAHHHSSPLVQPAK